MVIRIYRTEPLLNKANSFVFDTETPFLDLFPYLLPPKPQFSFRHLKRGIQDFHMNYVLVPADKAANNGILRIEL